MSTIIQITTAIKAILDAIDDVDQSSFSDFLPSVKTRKIALIMPPMQLSGRVKAPVGQKAEIVDRIPCEFWVRIENGNLAACAERAREICLHAAADLQATATYADALNGVVDYFGDDRNGNNAFAWSVDEQMVEIGKSTFLRATLFVTVTEWRNVTP